MVQPVRFHNSATVHPTGLKVVRARGAIPRVHQASNEWSVSAALEDAASLRMPNQRDPEQLFRVSLYAVMRATSPTALAELVRRTPIRGRSPVRTRRHGAAPAAPAAGSGTGPGRTAAYATLKRKLAALGLATGTYADVKDPACDIIIAAAEDWAEQTSWHPEPSDA